MTSKDFRDKYAIVGLGVIGIGRSGKSSDALAAEAIRLAVADAGLRLEDVDGFITHNSGMAGRGRATGDAARMAGLKNCRLIWALYAGGATGVAAVLSAIGAIEAGAANYVACVLASNERTQGVLVGGSQVTEGNAEAYGMFAPGSIHALMARRHMHEFGTTSRQLGWIAVTQREYANKRPEAVMYARKMTIEDHQNSRIIVAPLRMFDYCLVADHGIAAIVTTTERAKALKRQPVYIMGAGLSHQVMQDPREAYVALDIAEARDTAFKMAGIELKDIDVAQLYDCWTITVLLELEGYGFCKRGEGGAFVEAGNMRADGAIPTNTQGGGLSWAHARGYTQISEAVRQLRGEAGETQIKDAEICLVAGHGGNTNEVFDNTPCYQHGTLVLRR